MRVGMAADGPGARKWPVDGRRGSTGQSIARHVRRRPTPVSRPARRHPPAPPRTRPPARTPKNFSLAPIDAIPTGGLCSRGAGGTVPRAKGGRMELSEYFAKGLAAKHVMRMFHTRPCIRATEYDRTESRLVDLDVIHVRFDLNGQPFEVTIVLTPDGRAVLYEL